MLVIRISFSICFGIWIIENSIFVIIQDGFDEMVCGCVDVICTDSGYCYSHWGNSLTICKRG